MEESLQLTCVDTNIVALVLPAYTDKEIHECFKKGLCADPREGWYQGQIVFTDKYVIPLSKRSRRFLQGGFSDKLLHNGLTNQNIWMKHGKLATEIISNAVEEDEEEFDVLQRLFELSAL
jgi:hypothetical protein